MTDYILPEGVSRGQPGAVQFWSQRWTGRPYLDCLMYAGSMLLGYAGIAVGAEFGHQIRIASGDAVGGTGVNDLRRGVAKLLPWVQIKSGSVLRLQVVQKALAGQMYGVLIDFRHVPVRSRLRRFVGLYNGVHACVIAGARETKEGTELWWFDPMAPNGHKGRWLLASQILPWLEADAQGVHVYYTERGSGLIEFPMSDCADVVARVAQLEAEARVQAQSLKVATEGLERVGTELAAQRQVTGRAVAEAVAVAVALNGAVRTINQLSVDLIAAAARLSALDSVQGG